MSAREIAILVLGVWLLVSLAHRALALRAVGRHCSDGPAPIRAPTGRAVVLRPLHGAHPALERCLESLLRAAEVADCRVIVGAEDPGDPAAAVAKQCLEAASRTPAELRARAGPAARNRKVANLLQMAEGVEAPLLVLTDADVELGPDHLAGMLAHFADPRVGLATSPHLSVAAARWPSRLEALVANTHFLPNICIALDFEGLRFGLGAIIAVRSDALRDAGGLEALLDEPADDYALAQNVSSAGYCLAWHPQLVRHHLDDRGARASFHRHARWHRATRHSRPISYVGLLVDQGAIAALSLGVLIGGPLGLTLPAAWWGAQILGLARQRKLLKLRRRDLLLLPLVDLLAFAVFVAGFFGEAEPS